jgi:KDO2-lipid IV(A) lauroyltransferase
MPNGSRRRRFKNDVLYWSAVTAVRLGLLLPKSLLPAAGSVVGEISYWTLARSRALTLHNLGLVFPSLGPRERRALARRVFRCLGRNLTDTLALLDPRESEARTLRVPAQSAEALTEALAQRRGVIYVTAHLGPWERMASLLAREGFPITTLARESYDPRFHDLVYDPLRRRRRVEVIYRGSPGAPAALVRALRKGRVLGLLIDLPGRLATRPVHLLGQPSKAPMGPARLALRLGSPVVIGSPAPGRDGFPEVHIARLPTEDLADGERDEIALTQRMADALSDRIRAWPTAWPWMHPSFDPPAREPFSSIA